MSRIQKYMEPEARQKAPRASRKPLVRGVGYVLVMVGLIALAFDSAALLSGRGISHFSGLSDIWVLLNKDSMLHAQTQVGLLFGPQVWHSFLMPVLTLPAVLLFAPLGLYLMNATRPEITVRAPTAMEMELNKMGLSSSQRRSLRQAA